MDSQAFTYPEARMAFYPFWTKEEMETRMVLISGKSPEMSNAEKVFKDTDAKRNLICCENAEDMFEGFKGR